MREIKFRAWSGSKMLHTETGGIYLVGQVVQVPSSTGHEFYDTNYPIMQYTGLKDKNGVEIYEGDWCRCEFRGNGGIKVTQGKIFMDEYMWCIECINDETYSINRPHKFEVIGNIHENASLL